MSVPVVQLGDDDKIFVFSLLTRSMACAAAVFGSRPEATSSVKISLILVEGSWLEAEQVRTRSRYGFDSIF